MDQRLSIITLGVTDLTRAKRFYEALGWVASPASNNHIVFFQLNGMVLALYPWADLAKDAHLDGDEARPRFGGMALCYNTKDRTETDRVLARAIEVGARLLKPAQQVFWGGYAGYFADPDGHAWEVAFNPHSRLDPDGRFFIEKA